MINEASSSIVYHFTSIRNAYNIVKGEQFKLSPAFIHDVEMKHQDKLYYMSMARSRHGGYHRSYTTGVMFTLDGNKLNQRYKTKPVDYWSNSTINSDEMEDRLISDNHYIPIKDVVQEITLLINEYSHNVDKKIVYFLYVYGKKNNIPVLVYDDHKAFLLNNKRKALSNDIIKYYKYGNDEPEQSLTSDFSNLERFIRIFYNPYHKLSQDDMNAYNEIVKNVDFWYTLKSELMHSNQHKTYHYSRIGKMIRQADVKDFSELYDYVKNRITKEKHDLEKELRTKQYVKTYNDNKALYDHIVNVLDGEKPFNRELLKDDDEVAIMQLDKALRILDELDMISDRAKLVWFDEYGISEDAIKRLFKIDV